MKIDAYKLEKELSSKNIIFKEDKNNLIKERDLLIIKQKDLESTYESKCSKYQKVGFSLLIIGEVALILLAIIISPIFLGIGLAFFFGCLLTMYLLYNSMCKKHDKEDEKLNKKIEAINKELIAYFLTFKEFCYVTIRYDNIYWNNDYYIYLGDINNVRKGTRICVGGNGTIIDSKIYKSNEVPQPIDKTNELTDANIKNGRPLSPSDFAWLGKNNPTSIEKPQVKHTEQYDNLLEGDNVPAEYSFGYYNDDNEWIPDDVYNKED